MSTSTRLAFLAALTCGALACNQPNHPSSLALTETVHAQESTAGSFRFPSGAGMSEEGTWLFIRGGVGGGKYGPIGIAGNVHFTSLDGSGPRHLCVDGNNAVFASVTGCADKDDVAALKRQIAELQAKVDTLSHR